MRTLTLVTGCIISPREDENDTPIERTHQFDVTGIDQGELMKIIDEVAWYSEQRFAAALFKNKVLL